MSDPITFHTPEPQPTTDPQPATAPGDRKPATKKTKAGADKYQPFRWK